MNTRWAKMAAVISNAIISKCVLIYIGYKVGVYLDAKYGTEPNLMMVGVVTALTLGLTWIVFVAQRMKF